MNKQYNKKPKYLALILARKNSKRLKNKNILKLGNEPLVLITLKKLKKIKHLFKDILVSSDSEEIEKYSKKKNILFSKRPKYLAKFNTSSADSAIHVIKCYRKKYGFIDYVVLFQPTSRFRRNITVMNILKLSKKFPKKQIVGVNVENKKPNGVIYLSPVSILKKTRSFSFKNFIPLTIKSKKETIDIDTKKDFLRAKKYLKLNY